MYKMRLLSFMQMAEDKMEIGFATLQHELLLKPNEIEEFVIDGELLVYARWTRGGVTLKFAKMIYDLSKDSRLLVVELSTSANWNQLIQHSLTGFIQMGQSVPFDHNKLAVRLLSRLSGNVYQPKTYYTVPLLGLYMRSVELAEAIRISLKAGLDKQQQ